MWDIGISCGKDTKSRGLGSFKQCKSGMENQAGLCYTPCEAGTNPVGPVCWGNCPKGTKRCGVLCLGPDEECDKYVWNNVKNYLKLIGHSMIGNVPGAIAAGADVALSYTYPICKGFNPEEKTDDATEKELNKVQDEIKKEVKEKAKKAGFGHFSAHQFASHLTHL